MNEMLVSLRLPTTMQSGTGVDHRDDVLDCARELSPHLETRSRAAEQERSCPGSSIDEFRAAGLFRICQPARFGGYELGWDVRCEVAQILARGCAAQAWVYNQLSDATHLVGVFPLEAQEDVWGSNTDTRIACSFDPVGVGQRVDGGVRYSGKHNFASGIDWAEWLVCGGRIDGEKAPHFFLVPKSDVAVVDNWHVMGLAGTGSKGFVVDDVFIPEHRMITVSSANDGIAPGSRVNDAPVFRLPRQQVAVTGFAAVAVGIGEGFLDEFRAYSSGRTSRGEQVAAQTGTQISTGAAAAQVIAAGLTYMTAIKGVTATLERGETVTFQQRSQTQLASAYAARMTITAIQGLLIDAGGRALTLESAMQRRFRDLVAVASHRGLVWDRATAEYGRYLLGIT